MSSFDIKNLSVAVIMGGESAEREVSLRSGQAVLDSLIRQDINAIGLDGIKDVLATDMKKFDVVFNILHGKDGENGDLAGLLTSLEVNYTGSDSTGAVLSWHKDIAKIIVSTHNLATPKAQKVKDIVQLIIDDSGPWIIKPTQEGSSVGLYYAQTKDELIKNTKKALNSVKEVLVEQYISGTECTVSIINGIALPVIRIVPASGLYDYDAKYVNKSKENVTQYFCPSTLDEKVEDQLKKEAVIAFNALKLKGWGRVDFIVDDDDKCWFLEANTTPGMTQTSLVPKSAAAVGWSFDQLVLQILDTAFDEKSND